jgi:hypothetical protein
MTRRSPTGRRNQTQRLELNSLVETEIACPHCGESFPLLVDTTQGEQSFVEDCSVCCRPINLTIVCEPGEVLDVREQE